MALKTKTHLLSLGIGTLLAGFSLTTIVLVTNPESASKLTHSLFYLSLFLFVAGLLTMAGTIIRQRLFSGIYLTNFLTSLRQALLAAILVTLSLFLLAHGLLFWWIELILLAFLIFLEILLHL